MAAPVVPSQSNKKRVLPESQYDQSTFWGRFRHFYAITNPLNLLVTPEQRQAAVELLRAYQDGSADPPMDEVWRAKQIVDSSMQPQTGEVIFAPCRLAAFTPMNVVIAWGLLIPNAGVATTIFWQVANQIYNVGINYCNRNPSKEMSTEQFLGAFAAATASSAGVAVGLGQVVKRAHSIAPRAAGTIRLFVPFVAVATAGALNVFLMRRNEIDEGIDVKTCDGQLVGSSKEAGKMAVGLTAVSRVVTSLPILVVPPIAMKLIDRTSLLRRYPRLRLPVELGVITSCLLFGLPAAVGLFPRTMTVSPSKLEPQFHQMRNVQGHPIAELQFDKGL